jgi:hypothetical protein
LVTLKPTDPPAVPGAAVTVHVVPDPLTPVIVAPGDPVNARLAAVRPVAASLKVIVHENDSALVGLAPARVTESTVRTRTVIPAESAGVNVPELKRST